MSVNEFDGDLAELAELAAKLPEGGLGRIARDQAGGLQGMTLLR